MVQVVRVTRVPVPVSGGDDRTSTEFLSFFVGQVPVVTLNAIVDGVSKIVIRILAKMTRFAMLTWSKTP
jgi:hypothetical protein